MPSRIGRRRPYRLFIREWMEHRGLDNRRIAERMDCTEGTVSKLLNDDMRMTTDWLARFAYALDVEVADLYRDPSAPTQADLLRGVPEDDLPTVMRILKTFTGTDG